MSYILKVLEPYKFICLQCGKEAIGYRKARKFCCVKCANKYNNDKSYECKRRNNRTKYPKKFKCFDCINWYECNKSKEPLVVLECMTEYKFANNNETLKVTECTNFKSRKNLTY